MASVKRKKLSDFVIEEIKRMLLSGELQEGDKLPNQSEFAAQLGVSRPSLREALYTLTLVGAIEQRPGYGTVIRARVPALLADSLSPPLVSDIEATLELIESRGFIEVGIVELAVQNSTDEEIRQMATLIKDMTRAFEEGRANDYTELDMMFHYQIAEASHNRFMLYLFVTLRGLLEQFMRETFIVVPGLLERSLKFHVNIYEGIKDRNMQKAISSMKKHIQDIRRSLQHYYEVAHKKNVVFSQKG